MAVSKVKSIDYYGFSRKELKSIIEKAKIAKNGLEFNEVFQSTWRGAERTE